MVDGKPKYDFVHRKRPVEGVYKFVSISGSVELEAVSVNEDMALSDTK